MQVISPELISGKKILLRYDVDVPIKDGRVVDDYRLKVGMETLRMCLEHGAKVVLMGHIGRPRGEDKSLSIAPIQDWLESQEGIAQFLQSGKLKLLENLRFEEGEDSADLEYAREFLYFGDFFVNEAFAAHHKAASTTLVPTLMPHAAGLHFASEVTTLTEIKNNPQKPLVAIVGGAKVEDKYEAIVALSRFCDTVLVGGLLAKNIADQGLEVASNVVLGKLNEEGLDLAVVSLGVFSEVINSAKQIIWAGPVGKYEIPQGQHGNAILAHSIINSGAKSLIGGGDTIAAIKELGLLKEFDFVSVGGGAMLELLTKGTLPTIEVLK